MAKAIIRIQRSQIMTKIRRAVHSHTCRVTTPMYCSAVNAVVCNQVNSRAILVSNGVL